MEYNRRRFLRTGGLSLAFTGVVPAFIESCSQPGREATLLEDMTKDVQSLTDQDYLERQEKVRGLMAGMGVDALFYAPFN